MANRPFDMLNEAIGKEILVVLKGDVTIRGTLKSFDVHLNIVLENAEQLRDGQPQKKYGKLMVRGDSVILISP
ncbi:MAG: LSm family protein [Candidatus Diapherotrites archaeon]|nr:LSm family protein [Candidatus Diapherotrites archaeon]